VNYKDAVKLATKKHDGQYRDITGKPYICHPLAVAEKFDDENYKIVAILHDTIEDTDLTISELTENYGLKSELAEALDAITKIEGQTYIDFILQVKKNRIATAVKIEDINHNLSDIENDSLKEKYLIALYILQNMSNY